MSANEVFTDDDLKRLKGYINTRRDMSRDVPVHPEIAGFFSEVEALLARLEAAEAIVQRDIEGHALTIGLIEAWRKAAGK